MEAVLRTRTLNERQGFLNALVGADDCFLGFTAFGPEADEVMAGAQVAMAAGLHYAVLRKVVLTHPTIAEGFVVLFSAIPTK
jgi:pyruvate/2-oxoglutarate dehydrogenase complex dihydrolipoamide dehydrogenase (E3) component